MTDTARRWRLAGWILVATALSMGCSLSRLPYFLSAGDSREPPLLMPLTPPEKGKAVRIAVIAYAGGELRPEFVTAERDLAGQLAQILFQSLKEDKQAVSIVPGSKIQEFKDSHPGWKSMDLKEIAQNFKVDYLIYLEIDSLSLYETGSQNTLYRGRANITATVLNVHKPDESPYPKSFNCVYPQSRGPISVDESTPPRAFYLSFMSYIAKRLSWYFVPYEKNQEINCD